ncbi:hypothetical protein F2981_21170 (plasmid) [Sinorhizobium meliloti]|nr:hypothetical protein [Sinorhizobium meliloti]
MLLNGVGGSVILQDAIGYPQLQAAHPDVIPCSNSWIPSRSCRCPRTDRAALPQGASLAFLVMSKDNGCLFAGGPPVVKQAWALISTSCLGGADIHVRKSGLIDNQAANEDEALAMIRRALSYLPDNVSYRPPVSKEWREKRPSRSCCNCFAERPSNLRCGHLIQCVADEGSYFDIAPDHGRSVKLGLARIEGHTVGAIASDNRYIAGILGRSVVR